ncbi:MAG: hypothetical protein L0H53_09205 [Candidatus Nitrosocosmicus sp.]|nr:hypothetical protein [Candidatus Nitrosocosmicus sp.]MDN5867340.1 hypothetical protein [Candidatus Nitrosocosmicus sp.]
MRFQLLFLIRRDRNTSEEKLNMGDFYALVLGQVIYSERGESIEPLIEHIKPVLNIDPVHSRGCDKVYGIVLIAILLYQSLVYNNCKMKNVVLEEEKSI